MCPGPFTMAQALLKLGVARLKSSGTAEQALDHRADQSGYASPLGWLQLAPGGPPAGAGAHGSPRHLTARALGIQSSTAE
ncbi:MAG: hypothetical protein EB072_20650 [Betaproteobacteria bacterium]|nr:hypothetical protein [Betaproteobacteria bacterium]